MKKLLLCLSIFYQISWTIAQTPTTDTRLQKLQIELAAATYDTAKITTYVNLCEYFVTLESKSSEDSVLIYAKKAEVLAENFPNHAKIARLSVLIGTAYHSKWTREQESKQPKLIVLNQLKQDCEYYYKKAINDATRINDKTNLIKAKFNLTNLYYLTGDRRSSFKGFLDLTAFLEHKQQYSRLDSMVLMLTCQNLCTALDYDMNSALFNRYLAMFEKLVKKNTKKYDIYCLLKLEQCARFWKKEDEKRFVELYNQFKPAMTTYNIEDLDYYFAEYYFTIGEYPKALGLAEKLYPNIHNVSYYENDYKKVLSNLGKKYMLMGKSAYMLQKNNDAIKYLNQADRNFKQVVGYKGMEDELYTTFDYLSKAYQKEENYTKAYEYLSEAQSSYKQLHDKQVQTMLAENEVQLEQIKQDKKLHEARTQTLLKEKEVEIQKKQKYTFLIISIIALFSTAWAVYNFQKTRKQNQIISQQAVALEESNLLKDKIFALLSHDLRSPINRLVISLNQSIESQRTQIQSDFKNVQDVLNNVLYWASMQLKKTTPIYTAVPLQPLAETLIEEYASSLKEKEITFLNSIEDGCTLKTDENYLKIVLRNLISNAIKFTPNGGYIQIDCKIKEKIAEISLRDTGVGIAEAKMNILFQLPTPSVGTNQEKGTGLGLSLSYEIVKKLGGDIQIKTKVGKGTLVKVALPV